MIRNLDINHWYRRDVYNHFKDYEQPFFNICANVDVTQLRNLSRDQGVPFTIACHFFTLKAANELESFRYRLREHQVVIHERIHGASTLLLENQSFKFYHFDFDESFDRFCSGARVAIEFAHRTPELMDNQPERDNLIYYSVLPWISFTSFAHARTSNRGDSIPRIVFGKYFAEGERVKMPVSVEVHHALMDGVHVAHYFELVQKYLDSPLDLLGVHSLIPQK